MRVEGEIAGLWVQDGREEVTKRGKGEKGKLGIGEMGQREE